MKSIIIGENTKKAIKNAERLFKARGGKNGDTVISREKLRVYQLADLENITPEEAKAKIAEMKALMTQVVDKRGEIEVKGFKDLDGLFLAKWATGGQSLPELTRGKK